MRRGVSHHVRGYYPPFVTPTGSSARPYPSRRLQLSLIRRALAGCRQSLLGNGPSRLYLCNPCAGAWTPIPRCPPSALARCFPGDNGLTLDIKTSAHRLPLQCNFNREWITGLQSFLYVQAPTLARPPGCTHRIASSATGGQAVYTTHSSVGYLPRDVASLRIRHGQLIRLDSHQLDCSLVGRSDISPLASFFP